MNCVDVVHAIVIGIAWISYWIAQFVMLPVRCLTAAIVSCLGCGIQPDHSSSDGVGTAVTLFSSVISLTIALFVAVRASERETNSDQSILYLEFYAVLALLPVMAMVYFVRSRNTNGRRAYSGITVRFYYLIIPASLCLIGAVARSGYQHNLPGQPAQHVFQVANVDNSDDGSKAINASFYLNPSIYNGPLPKGFPIRLALPHDLVGHWQFGRIDLYELLPGQTPAERLVKPGGYVDGDDDTYARVSGLKTDGAYRAVLYFFPLDDAVSREKATRLLLNTRSGIRIAQEAKLEMHAP